MPTYAEAERAAPRAMAGLKPFLAFCGTYLLANLSVGAMPVLFGGFVDERHIALNLAGSIAAAETTGLAIGSALTIALIARCRLSAKALVGGGLFACAIAQFVTAISIDATMLIAARLMSGICTALVQAPAIAWISRQPNPQRPLAIFVSMAFLAGAIGIPFFTFTLASFGLSGTFLAFAGLLLVAMLAIPAIPGEDLSTPGASETQAVASRQSGNRTTHLPLLIAISFNFVVNSGLWVYLERIGEWAGIAPAPVASALSISMFAAMAATITLGIAGARFKIGWVTVFAHAALIVSAAAFFRVGSWMPFTAAVVIFNIGVALLPPALLSTLAVIDPSGRSALRGVTAINIGYAAGPQVYSWMVTNLGLATSLAATIAVFCLGLPVCLRGLRTV